MLKKSFLSLATLLALTAVGTVTAAPLPLISAGDIKFTLDNYDSATTGYGNAPGVVCATVAACDAAAASKAPGSVGSVNPSADTMGLFSIATISNVTLGTTVFTKGGGQGFITGIFGNLSDRTAEVTCGLLGCNTAVLSTGGFFQMWLNDADYDPSQGPLVGAGKDLNAGLYPGVSGGILLLSGTFTAGGVLFGDMLSSYFTSFNNGTFGGNGQGFLDITGGLWASAFDTNSLTNANGGKSDLFLTNTFDDVNGAASSIGWTVKSTAQVTGASVPEPTSIGLAALALVGLGAALRRSKKN
jgi:PEP-CTERM motif